MNPLISKLHQKENLSEEEIKTLMRSIMTGSLSREETTQFLMDLRAKGATIQEVTGAAKVMRQFVIPVKSKHKSILDTCGTGGDKKNTFNISTITAIVAASAGCILAKHGNRSVSSKCGSADILEALGVNIDIDEKKMGECLDQVGIAFLFAQKLHPAMKNVASIRKELGVETIFNILGPLTNPALATHQMMGVYKTELVEPMANVLKNLGVKKALVVHGADGLDEITLTDKTFISEFNGTDVIFYDIEPEELGFERSSLKDLQGGDIKTNVAIIENILSGKKGPKRDVVLVNVAYALYIAERVKSISDGIRLAEEALDQGLAAKKLDELRRFTNHS